MNCVLIWLLMQVYTLYSVHVGTLSMLYSAYMYIINSTDYTCSYVHVVFMYIIIVLQVNICGYFPPHVHVLFGVYLLVYMY